MLAAGVCLSLIAQIAEQIDYLRFMPPRTPENSRRWWTAMILAGPGWVIFGALKQIVGLFLAVYLIANAVQTADVANQPVHQFLEIYTDIMPAWLALTLAVILVVISQIKINVTNAYSGSLAWTNSFTRVTKHYPGRLVFLGVNLLIALILMEANMFDFLNTILGLLRQLRDVLGGRGGHRHRDQQVPAEALADPAGVPPRDAVPGQPGRLRFDDRLRRGVDRGVLRRLRPGHPAVLAAGGDRAGPGAAADPGVATKGRYYLRRTDDGIDLPMYDEYGNPSGELLHCHVCQQDLERPDVAKCADPRRRRLLAVPEHRQGRRPRAARALT